MYMYLFLWFFFIVKNFQILVYKENVCPFISMVLFYSYKFSNIGTQRKCVSFISMVPFYSCKFLKMGIQRTCVSSFCFRFRLSCLSILI